MLQKLAYHGQQDDLDAEERRDPEDNFQTSGEIMTSGKSRDRSLEMTESGDHLFFEDLNLFNKVKALDIVPGSKKNKKANEVKKVNVPGVPDRNEENVAFKNHLTEIDQQYFGTLSNIKADQGLFRVHHIDLQIYCFL